MHPVYLLVQQAKLRRHCAPPGDGTRDFPGNRAGFVRARIEIRRRLERNIHGCGGVCEINRRAEEARFQVGGRGIQVVGRRKPPASVALVNKRVIAQVIISIRRHDIEHDAPPQLPHVVLWFSAIPAQGIRDFHIAVGFVVRSAQHTHSGEKRYSPECGVGTPAVETFDYQHGLLSYRNDARGCYRNSCLARQLQRHSFPEHCRHFICFSRELGDSQRAVLFPNRGFGPRASQRRPGRQQQTDVFQGFLFPLQPVAGGQ